MRAQIAALLALAACGDDRRVEDVFEAVSGSRLKLEWHLYEDGTRQAGTSAFYDTQVHSRCTPQLWVDGVIRCVPIAEDAVYVNDTCENLVGRASAIAKPTHFIGYDGVGDTTLPARVYVAGTPVDAISQFYAMRDSECTGPFFSSSDVTYYALVDEIAGSSLVPIVDSEAGAGRLAVRYRSTEDGVSLPLGLLDRDLGGTCSPTRRTDGDVRCEPDEATHVSLFRDPQCEDHVVAIAGSAPVPAIARVPDPSGCVRFHAVGAELAGPVFRKDGQSCTQLAPSPSRRLYAIGAELDLPTLGRTIEDADARRLQRIVLTTDDLRFIDERLFDTATRADCQRGSLGDKVRCLPAAVVPASTMLAASCAVDVRVAEVPLHTCERVSFATDIGDEGTTLHAIGDRPTAPLFQRVDSTCQPYVAAPDRVVHSVGPALAPETFSSAVTYGER